MTGSPQNPNTAPPSGAAKGNAPSKPFKYAKKKTSGSAPAARADAKGTNEAHELAQSRPNGLDKPLGTGKQTQQQQQQASATQGNHPNQKPRPNGMGPDGKKGKFKQQWKKKHHDVAGQASGDTATEQLAKQAQPSNGSHANPAAEGGAKAKKTEGHVKQETKAKGKAGKMAWKDKKTQHVHGQQGVAGSETRQHGGGRVQEHQDKHQRQQTDQRQQQGNKNNGKKNKFDKEIHHSQPSSELPKELVTSCVITDHEQIDPQDTQLHHTQPNTKPLEQHQTSQHQHPHRQDHLQGHLHPSEGLGNQGNSGEEPEPEWALEDYTHVQKQPNVLASLHDYQPEDQLHGQPHHQPPSHPQSGPPPAGYSEPQQGANNVSDLDGYRAYYLQQMQLRELQLQHMHRVQMQRFQQMQMYQRQQQQQAAGWPQGYSDLHYGAPSLGMDGTLESFSVHPQHGGFSNFPPSFQSMSVGAPHPLFGFQHTTPYLATDNSGVGTASVRDLMDNSSVVPTEVPHEDRAYVAQQNVDNSQAATINPAVVEEQGTSEAPPIANGAVIEEPVGDSNDAETPKPNEEKPVRDMEEILKYRKCHFCKQVGHMRRDCPEKFAKRAAKEKEIQEQQQQQQHHQSAGGKDAPTNQQSKPSEEPNQSSVGKEEGDKSQAHPQPQREAEDGVAQSMSPAQVALIKQKDEAPRHASTNIFAGLVAEEQHVSDSDEESDSAEDRSEKTKKKKKAKKKKKKKKKKASDSAQHEEDEGSQVDEDEGNRSDAPPQQIVDEPPEEEEKEDDEEDDEEDDACGYGEEESPWYDESDAFAGETVSIEIGEATQGGKGNGHPMEDRHCIFEDLNEELGLVEGAEALGVKPPPEHLYVGVFDGHGGSFAAEYCAQNLHKYFTKPDPVVFRFEPVQALRSAFLQLEDDLEKVAKEKGDKSGSCATCVVTRGRRMWVLNIGDCRCIVVRGDAEGSYHDLTLDHRATLKSERQRILDADGTIEDNRVFGILAPSRSFGDWNIKSIKEGVVIADPHVSEYELLQKDKFVVVGSDGVWDVMGSAKVAKLVSKMSGKTATKIAQEIIKEVRKRSAKCYDDVTVVVLKLF